MSNESNADIGEIIITQVDKDQLKKKLVDFIDYLAKNPRLATYKSLWEVAGKILELFPNPGYDMSSRLTLNLDQSYGISVPDSIQNTYLNLGDEITQVIAPLQAHFRSIISEFIIRCWYCGDLLENIDPDPRQTGIFNSFQSPQEINETDSHEYQDPQRTFQETKTEDVLTTIKFCITFGKQLTSHLLSMGHPAAILNIPVLLANHTEVVWDIASNHPESYKQLLKDALPLIDRIVIDSTEHSEFTPDTMSDTINDISPIVGIAPALVELIKLAKNTPDLAPMVNQYLSKLPQHTMVTILTSIAEAESQEQRREDLLNILSTYARE